MYFKLRSLRNLGIKNHAQKTKKKKSAEAKIPDEKLQKKKIGEPRFIRRGQIVYIDSYNE